MFSGTPCFMSTNYGITNTVVLEKHCPSTIHLSRIAHANYLHGSYQEIVKLSLFVCLDDAQDVECLAETKIR